MNDEAAQHKMPNNLLDSILIDLVALLKKLSFDNKILLEAVLQAIGEMGRLLKC